MSAAVSRNHGLAAIPLFGLSAMLAACGGRAGASTDDRSVPALEARPDGIAIPQGSPLRGRIHVEPVLPRLVRHELVLPATAEADPAKMAKVSPPLPGRVSRLMVRLGQAVKRDEALFTLSSSELVAAQTDYLKACSAEAQARRALARQEDLCRHGIGAKRDLEQAQTDLEIGRSELDRATTRLRLLGMNPGQVGKPLVVRAPVSGRVIDLATASGEYQNDPAAVLMTIADLSTIWVSANLPEKDVQRVAVGDDATIEFAAFPSQRWDGTVQRIGEVLAQETRTAKVRIELGNAEGRLKPGMFAKVRLRGKPSSELLVPPTALLVRGTNSFVVVEKEPWLFQKRLVEVGDTLAEGACIVRGLADGERVVTSNTIVFP